LCELAWVGVRWRGGRTSQEVKRLSALKTWAGTDGGIALVDDVSCDKISFNYDCRRWDIVD
jgi:hypothetical protein